MFCWIPSHVGIMGNDRADEAAKRASKGLCTRSLPLPARDLYPVFSGFIRGKWQSEWERNVSSKLKAIKPSLGSWRSSSRNMRVEEVKLCRLRIGHTLATHRYLLCDDSRPRCSRCGDFLSVSHVLVSCTDLAPIRVRYFGARALTLKDLLGDTSSHISAVLKYLDHIKFTIIYSPKG